MPSSLAAFVYCAFAVWLLRRNSKTTGGVSGALWVPTIWLAILSSRPIGFWLSGGDVNSDPSAYLDGSPIDRNIYLLLIFAGVVLLFRRQIDWHLVFRGNRWLWIFYSFMCLSVLWSDHSFVALKRIIKDFGNVIMILLIVTEEDPVEAVRQVLLRCAYVLIPLSVLAVKYYLDVGRYYNQWTWRAYFCGITTDKNALGRLAMLSIFAVLWTMSEERKGSNLISLVKRKWPEIIILCMCLWIWKEADSATAIGCGVLGLGILFSSNSSWVRRNPRLLGTAAFGFIAISLLFLCIPDLRAIVTSSLGRNVNLTERTDIWEGAMRLGTNPLVGEGFDSVWLTDKGRALLNSLQAAHGHNGFLETYLNGGLIGLGLLLAMLFRGGQDIVRKLATGSPIGPFFAALFCTCFIYNYTEAALNNNNSAGFTLFLSAFGYPFAARHFADCEINAPIESDTQNSHEVIG